MQTRAGDAADKLLAATIDRVHLHLDRFAGSGEAGTHRLFQSIDVEPKVQTEEMLADDFVFAKSPEIVRAIVPDDDPELVVDGNQAAAHRGQHALEKRVHLTQL